MSETISSPKEMVSSSSKVAAVFSEVLGPPALLTVVIFEAAFISAGWTGFWFAILAVSFVVLGPYLTVIALSRFGKVSDRYLGNRKQRAPVLAFVLLSISVGFILLVALGAPHELVVVTLCSGVGLTVLMVVNLWWKMSIHSAFASFFTIAQLAFFGIAAVLVLLIPGLVGWARVRLQAHTPAQVCFGAGAGIVVAGLLLVLL